MSYTSILVRDSLTDNGVVPSPPYAWASPDIICTQQQTYANPQAQFGTAASYATSPGINTIQGQNNNYYVRGYNMGPVASAATSMYLYWSRASLLMTPSTWMSQPLISAQNGNHPYVNLPSASANSVVVSPQCFNWTPPVLTPQDHFCLVSAVNVPGMTWPPAAPPTFSTPADFVLWVRMNQNICYRNLTVLSNPNIPSSDRVDQFSNPFATDQAALMVVNVQNMPVGTVLNLICTALGVKVTATVTSVSSTLVPVLSAGPLCPAGYVGQVETTVKLPTGTPWPANGVVQTSVAFLAQNTATTAKLASSTALLQTHRALAQAMELGRKVLGVVDDPVLVEVGNTNTAYQPAL